MDTRAPTSTAPIAATQRRPARRRTLISAILGAAIVAIISWVILVPEPIPVEVTTVTQGPMQVTINNQGQVRVQDKYIVAAPFAAELTRIALDEGDRVQRGQVMLNLNPLPLDARQRQEAVARLDAAKALAREAGLQVRRAYSDMRLATNERARIERLVADKFMSQQAIDRAVAAEQSSRAAWHAARSGEQAAIADVRLAEAALSSAPGRQVPLTAPVDGYVLKVHEESARTINAGAPLISIGDPTQYEVVVDVLSTDAVKIKPGDTMLLEDWGGDRTLRARVRLIEPVAFTKISALGVEEQRVNVIAHPIDPLGPLGDGYRIEARIVIWSDDQALKVAGSSLFRVGDAWHVFVIENGRARERTVKLGQRNQNEAQILSGLAAGTRVIRYPNNQLQDNARVVSADNAGKS
ncbi:MAG TPA: efflux RND transporter periplasmic adaptor subunit [Noviherbaspirillum sp.]|nr:efflux RND transporter periplasmic adaptor subunit [Noviherbaspirillum sp.]